MEWSKIKNIIIIILLTVNVFLLVLTANQELKARQYREDTRAGAVEVLRQQGIAVDLAKLPEESRLVPQSAERDRGSEARMAETLLGLVVRTDDGGRVTYTGNSGEAWFRGNGKFGVSFQGQVWPVGEQGMGEHATSLLAGAGFPCTVTGIEAKEQETVVTVRQTWEGTPVFTCRVELRYRDGALVSVEGQRVTGTPAPQARAAESLDVATVLVRFLSGMRDGGHVFGHIEGISSGYQSNTSPGGVTELVPVWEFVTDGGTFYVDGSTGTLGQIGG